MSKLNLTCGLVEETYLHNLNQILTYLNFSIIRAMSLTNIQTDTHFTYSNNKLLHLKTYDFSNTHPMKDGRCLSKAYQNSLVN